MSNGPLFHVISTSKEQAEKWVRVGTFMSLPDALAAMKQFEEEDDSLDFAVDHDYSRTPAGATAKPIEEFVLTVDGFHADYAGFGSHMISLKFDHYTIEGKIDESFLRQVEELYGLVQEHREAVLGSERFEL